MTAIFNCWLYSGLRRAKLMGSLPTMNTTRILLAALFAGSGAGFLSAQTPTAYPGTKANFTLSITATSEVGGFLVKESALEANEANGITYHDISDPLGYEPNESDPAHHSRVKETQKSKTFGSGDTAEPLVTESVVDDVAKLVSQKFTNADFIQHLIDRGLVNIESPRGYRLVVVQPQVLLDQYYNEPPLLFFIENGTSIYYVGRQSGDDHYAGDALLLDFSDNAEAYNYKSRRVFKHRTETETVDGTSNTIVIPDEVGTRTVTDTFSGRSLVHVSLFGSYYDEELGDYVGPEGVGFYAYGELKYSGRYDAKAGLYITTTASLTGAVGSFYDVQNVGETDDQLEPEGLNNISFGISGTKKIDDITPYLNALPEALSSLKAQIIEGYSTGGE